MTNFKTIDYLQLGNTRQKLAYQELTALYIFEQLKQYNPILTGTIPIDLDLPESDLDVICVCENHVAFSALLTKLFGEKDDFEIESYDWKGLECTVAKFRGTHFEIEIFGQNIPTEKQNAYQHMLIEYEILNERGAAFKAEVKKLKAQGWKTEPAFANLLGLEGDPYEALLDV